MQNVLITGGARYVGHVLTPVGVLACGRSIAADMFCLRYHPNCRRAASLMRSEVQGRSQTSSTLIALVSEEGTFQSSLLCRCARRTATLVMVSCIASRTAPGCAPIRGLSLLLRL